MLNGLNEKVKWKVGDLDLVYIRFEVDIYLPKKLRHGRFWHCSRSFWKFQPRMKAGKAHVECNHKFQIKFDVEIKKKKKKRKDKNMSRRRVHIGLLL